MTTIDPELERHIVLVGEAMTATEDALGQLVDLREQLETIDVEKLMPAFSGLGLLNSVLDVENVIGSSGNDNDPVASLGNNHFDEEAYGKLPDALVTDIFGVLVSYLPSGCEISDGNQMRIIKTMKERFSVLTEVAKAKKVIGQNPNDLTYHAGVIRQRVEQGAQLGLSESFVVSLLNIILAHSREYQQQVMGSL